MDRGPDVPPRINTELSHCPRVCIRGQDKFVRVSTVEKVDVLTFQLDQPPLIATPFPFGAIASTSARRIERASLTSVIKIFALYDTVWGEATRNLGFKGCTVRQADLQTDSSYLRIV